MRTCFGCRSENLGQHHLMCAVSSQVVEEEEEHEESQPELEKKTATLLHFISNLTSPRASLGRTWFSVCLCMFDIPALPECDPRWVRCPCSLCFFPEIIRNNESNSRRGSHLKITFKVPCLPCGEPCLAGPPPTVRASAKLY